MKSKPKDPFALKSLSKRNPSRVGFTLYARVQDHISRIAFDRYAIPCVNEPQPAMQSSYESSETAVTPRQMSVIDLCVEHTDRFSTPIIEIGAFRGVTTSRMASRTTRDVLAVDPYMGYGGADEDMAAMKSRTQSLQNVTHLRLTSGEASRLPQVDRVSFVFVDGVHDYVNAWFDGVTWGGKLESSGLIAFHDTDNRYFAGVQRAVWQIAKAGASPRFRVFSHTTGIVVLERT